MITRSRSTLSRRAGHATTGAGRALTGRYPKPNNLGQSNERATDGQENVMNRVDSGLFYALRSIAVFYAAVFLVGWVLIKVFG